MYCSQCSSISEGIYFPESPLSTRKKNLFATPNNAGGRIDACIQSEMSSHTLKACLFQNVAALHPPKAQT